MENKRKHLEFIQGVINRMAGNLFFLKGWTITLITALFALFFKGSGRIPDSVVYLPVIIFWILDGYFLSQERLFRNLYNHVRKLSEEEIDFSMDINKFREYKNSWIFSMFSSTLLFFYLPLIIIILLVMSLIN